jgi:hypothetical protein
VVVAWDRDNDPETSRACDHFVTHHFELVIFRPLSYLLIAREQQLEFGAGKECHKDQQTTK